MERLSISQNLFLMIMLLAIITNIVVFHLFQSHNGFFYISIIGFLLVVVYTTDLLHSKINWYLLFIFLSLAFLYSLYFFLSKDFTEWAQVPSLFLASVNLLLIFISLGVIMTGRSSLDSTNLKLCILVLFILGTYSFFTVLAQNTTSTNFNTYLVYFLLSGSLLFIVLELSKQYANRSNQSKANANNIGKVQQDDLENIEAIQEQIALFFKENTTFIDPDFNYDDFIAALPFSRKEVSNYLNHYQSTSFYQVLGKERAKYAAKQLEENQLASIKSIKLEAGFKSYSSFIRNFKRVYGMTPSEYRSNF